MQLWSPFSDVDPSRGESEGWNCQNNLPGGGGGGGGGHFT